MYQGGSNVYSTHQIEFSLCSKNGCIYIHLAGYIANPFTELMEFLVVLCVESH